MKIQNLNEKTALVLSGGDSKGAIEVGFYQALLEKGIEIDFIVGSSIGAINGAFIAAGISPGKLSELWKNLNIQDLYGFNWVNLWKFFRSNSLYDHSRFRRFLERHLPAKRFEDLQIPLIVPCTNFQTGEPLYLRQGNLLDALMASVAMPGIFPPQFSNGYQLVDGGVAENMPLDVAVSEGANLIFAIQYNCCNGTHGPVHGLLNILSHAFSIALDRKTMCDIRHYQSKAKLVILEPTFGLNIELLDFRYSAQLIEKAYLFAKETLNNEFGPKVP